MVATRLISNREAGGERHPKKSGSRSTKEAPHLYNAQLPRRGVRSGGGAAAPAAAAPRQNCRRRRRRQRVGLQSSPGRGGGRRGGRWGDNGRLRGGLSRRWRWRRLALLRRRDRRPRRCGGGSPRRRPGATGAAATGVADHATEAAERGEAVAAAPEPRREAGPSRGPPAPPKPGGRDGGGGPGPLPLPRRRASWLLMPPAAPSSPRLTPPAVAAAVAGGAWRERPERGPAKMRPGKGGRAGGAAGGAAATVTADAAAADAKTGTPG